MTAAAPALTLADAARMMREAMRDKSYRAFPLGQDAAGYLFAKRKRLTDASYRDYEGSLDKFVRYFCDLQITDFEPPVGTRRVEEFLDFQYGKKAPRTYNKNLSILRDFFKHQVLRGELHGDPTLAIERARSRGVYRTTFSPDQIRAIIASQEDVRDRLAVRLLLDYGLRKGALAAVQFKHFDHYQRRLTIFTKGATVRTLPIPSKPFWNDLERLLVESELPAEPLLDVPAEDDPARRGPPVSLRSRSAATACTAGGTGALSAPASSRRARSRGRGCTRPATPPANASWTPRET